jgi:DNA-binding HxlR family transcriptional regulator
LIDWIVCYQLEDSEDLREIYARKDILISKVSFEVQESDNHDRNLHILSLLSKEPNAEVTFQGLKRKLGWHQEILSRTLKRLKKDGALLKTPSGAYKLNTKEKHSYASQHGKLQKDVMPVTQLWLSQDLNPGILISKLKNTWFGAWRWYGFNEDGSEKVLTWLSEDGIWVNLRIRDAMMFIEAGPVGSVGRERCIRAGYELLSHVIRLYKSSLVEPKAILQPN